jgi:hypothetical protein
LTLTKLYAGRGEIHRDVADATHYRDCVRRFELSGWQKFRSTLAQSFYLILAMSATIGWIWLLTSIAVELLS